jgi:diguanylate cyclase (GGDEF)-like protein/PAS domain S-box-containing protein
MSTRGQLLARERAGSVLVEHLPDMVLVVDRLGQFRFTNRAVQRFLGRTPHELAGTNALDLIHADDRGAAIEHLARAATGDIDQDIHGLRVLAADGTYKLVEITAENCIEDPDVQGIVACVRDVSSRPSADAEVELLRRRFEYAFDHSPFARAVVALDGSILRINRRMAEMSGYAPEQLVGMTVNELAHPDELSGESSTATRVQLGEIDSDTAERRLHRADGTDLWVRRTFWVVRDGSGNAQHVSLALFDISDLHEAEMKRRDAESMVRSLLDNSSEIIVVVDADGRRRWTSGAVTRALGFPQVHDPVNDNMFDRVHPQDRPKAEAVMAALREHRLDPEETLQLRVEAADGSWHVLELRGRNLVDDPAVQGLVFFARDVTQGHAAEQQVMQLRDALEASTELVFFSDPLGRIQYANARATQLLGLRAGDQPFEELDRFVAPDSLERMRHEIVEAIADPGIWSGELTLVSSEGRELPVTCTIQRHDDENGEPSIVSAIAHDIHELKVTQRLLRHQATHDGLTMLPNRQLFHELGEQALARAEREGTTVAVLFLDLDRFKDVNDTHGHQVGDELLVEIARRLRESVRRGDVLARFGGDEFIVVCEHPDGPPEVLELAARLIEAASEEVVLGAITAQVGMSIGIAIGAGGRVTIDNLLRDADAALYQAKARGRDRAVVFGGPTPTERPTLA